MSFHLYSDNSISSSQASQGSEDPRTLREVPDIGDSGLQGDDDRQSEPASQSFEEIHLHIGSSSQDYPFVAPVEPLVQARPPWNDPYVMGTFNQEQDADDEAEEEEEGDRVSNRSGDNLSQNSERSVGWSSQNSYASEGGWSQGSVLSNHSNVTVGGSSLPRMSPPFREVGNTQLDNSDLNATFLGLDCSHSSNQGEDEEDEENQEQAND